MGKAWITYCFLLIGIGLSHPAHGKLFPNGEVPGSFPVPENQDRIQQELESNIEHLYLSAAEEQISLLSNPTLQPYYQAKILFIRNLALQDPDTRPRYYQSTEKLIKELGKLPEDMPLKRVMLAETYFQNGMIRFLDKSYLSAASDLQEACDLVQRNREDFPNNVEQLKLLGAYHVALASVPKKFRWLTRLLCFRGDLETGIRQLELASKESELMPHEAEVLLFYVEKNLLNQPEEANERMRRLYETEPDCFTWNFFLVSTYLDLHQTDSALILLKKGDHFRSDPELLYPPFWDYLQGKAHYYRLENSMAQVYFGRFLEKQKGPVFRSDAMFRSGISMVLNENYPRAQKVFQRILDENESGLDADEYALKMAERFSLHKPTEPEKLLFGARNLFDGGYSSESLILLEEIEKKHPDLNVEDQTELEYRYARNYHHLYAIELARTYYSRCAAQTSVHNKWMSVYSLYYLGQIEEWDENPEKARQLYKKALQEDDYFYQSGLEQRCKAALAQLKTP